MGAISSVLSIVDKLLDKDLSKIYDSRDYRFEEYNKHVTVYRNGNGILIVSFLMKVRKPERIKGLYRRLGIKDSKNTTIFPKLNDMKSENIDNRFTCYGFWVDSDDNIVTKAQEHYWSDDDYNTVDQIAKNDKKELRWKFIINEGKLTKRKKYRITYIISVPGMFPIENGFYYRDLHNPIFENYVFNSSMTVEHVIKKLSYTVSFENGIELDEMPRCVICQPKKGSLKQDPLIHGSENDNIIFKKFTYTIKSPKFKSKIKINWNIKEKTRNH